MQRIEKTKMNATETMAYSW